MTSFAPTSRWFGPLVLSVLAIISTRVCADDAKTLSPAEVDRVQQLRIDGKSQEAIAWLDDQPSTLALDERATALRGLAKYDLNDLTGLTVDVARFREYPGSDPYVLTLLGHVYGDPGQIQHLPLAKTYYDRALTAAPDLLEAKFGQARRNALAAQTVANVDAVLAFEPSKDRLPAGLYVHFAAEVAKVAATALARNGDRGDETLRLFEMARALTPDDPDPLCGAALTYVLQRNDERAAPLLDELEKRFPEHLDDVFYTRAVMARLAGKNDEAIEAARQAFLLRADHVPALELAGELLFDQGKLEEVRPLIERVKKAGKPSDRTLLLSAKYFLKRADDIPTTKAEGQDDAAFAASQAKRHEFLKQSMGECMTLRSEQLYHVENLEMLTRICDAIGPEANTMKADVKRALDFAKKRAAAKKG